MAALITVPNGRLVMSQSLVDGGEPAIATTDGVTVTAMVEAVERSIEEGKPIAPARLLSTV
jgi:hypothetical protein